LRRFAFEDVFNVGIKLVAHLSQRNFIFSLVIKDRCLLLFGLEFILLLISIGIYSFFGQTLCSFSLYMSLFTFLSFGWEFEILTVRVRMSQFLFNIIIDFKTFALAKTNIIHLRLPLSFSILSRSNIRIISLSGVILNWFCMVFSNLHFLGTTAFMNIYFVLTLFHRLNFSIISQIHTVIFGEFSTRFLLDGLRLTRRRQLRDFSVWIGVFLNFACYNRGN
jgi:hypothetical protein